MTWFIIPVIVCFVVCALMSFLAWVHDDSSWKFLGGMAVLFVLIFFVFPINDIKIPIECDYKMKESSVLFYSDYVVLIDDTAAVFNKPENYTIYKLSNRNILDAEVSWRYYVGRK